MSVINEMLRDLAARESAVAGTHNASANIIAALPASPSPASLFWRRWLPLFSIFILAILAMWAYGQKNTVSLAVIPPAHNKNVSASTQSIPVMPDPARNVDSVSARSNIVSASKPTATSPDLVLAPAKLNVITSTTADNRLRIHAEKKNPVTSVQSDDQTSVELADASTQSSPVSHSKLTINPHDGFDAVFWQQRLAREGAGAAGDLQKYVDSHPQQVSAQRMLIVGLSGQDMSAATAQAQNALAGNRDSVVLRQLLADLLCKQGRYVEAIQILQEHAPAPRDAIAYHALWALALQQSGQHKAAIERYTILTDIEPQRGVHWAGLAMALEASAQTLAQNDDDAVRQNAAAKYAYQRALNDVQLAQALRDYVQARLVSLASFYSRANP